MHAPSSAAHDDRIADPERGLLTAEFVDKGLEQAFRREQFTLEDGRFVRIAITVSTVVFLCYALHDLLVIPQAAGQALRFRFGLFAPLALLCVGACFSPWFERLHQLIAVSFGTAATVTVLLIGAVSPAEAFYPYTTYATIFVTMGPFLLKMRVLPQVAYVLISLIAYDAVHALYPVDLPHVVFSIHFSLVSMGALGAFIARQQGHDARTGFLQRRLIASQVDIIDEERRKAESLLLNILPGPIAERLKTEQRAIADGFGEVTVLFSDIVGFTTMSERLSPAEVVDRLNSLFSAFDDDAAALGLEKIKTIGDAYMLVGGLPSPRDDHAEAVAEMALRMQTAVKKAAAELGESLDVRIGIHTGPVVAGVIGKRKFAYDVWGDTVNTASRMESHSEPGKIQLTETTAKRLSGKFTVAARGTIVVKGKGPMATYFLEGRASG